MKQHHCLTSLLRCAVAMGVLFCNPTFGDDEVADAGPAIPPGQENLLLEMLGPGAPLPGCELADGQVNYTVVALTFDCAGGAVEYELAHRSKATRAATPTNLFAITLVSGTPPRGFPDALVSLIRSRENEFEFVWPGEDDAD